MTALSDESQNRLNAILMRTSGESRMSSFGRMQLNCDRHGPYMANGTQLTKRVVWSPCPACKAEEQQREIEMNRRAAKAMERERIQQGVMRAGLPARFIGRTLESFNAESQDQQKALAISKEFVADWKNVYKKGMWLVFSGKPGTGKSHLAVAILQALMPEYVGRYMTCMELFQKIRGTWRRDSELSEEQVISEMASTPLLVIDEIGAQNGTDSEMLHLFDVLDKRYRDMMPTILLTNQNKEGFKQFVGDRVYDRMTECAKWVPFAWDSYRPQARKEMADA